MVGTVTATASPALHHIQRAATVDRATRRGRRGTCLGAGGPGRLREDDARAPVVAAAVRPGRVVPHYARLGRRRPAGGAAGRAPRVARPGAAARAGEGRDDRVGQPESAAPRPRTLANVREAVPGRPPRGGRVGGRWNRGG